MTDPGGGPRPVRPRHMARAARVVAAMGRPTPLDYRVEPVPLEGAPGVAYVFDPPRRAPDGAVVIIPGLTLKAHDDDRLHALARAFARGGLRGIVLEVPDMGRLQIRPETEVDLSHRLVALLDAGLIPNDRLGLLGPSFSGSLGLRAAALPLVADRVHSVLTVGAFADAVQTVDFLFHDDGADPYGRMLLMLNFLQWVQPASPALLDALRVAIKDTATNAGDPDLPAALETLSEADRATLVSILEDEAAWRSVGDHMLERGGQIFGDMSVAPIADQLRCQVFVLHGANDPIVPADESVRLHACLQAAGRPSFLLVTSLLDHADVKIGPDVVQQAWRMTRGFAFFIAGLGV